MTTVALLAIVALVLVNGFFVAAEFALVSARPERMTGPETGVRRLVRRQMGSLDEYLAACQLGITIASLALGAIGEPTIANLIEPALGSRLAADAVAVIATIGALLIMTALHITIGEQAPKSFAIGSAERVVVLVAWPLEVFHRSLQIAKRLRGTDAGKRSRGRHFARQQAFVPDAGKVRTPIRRAWRGREHVHTAIRVPRRRGGLD